jgi:N-acetylglucosaminyldiphosphoundecaprenol N-acetyl-beta-D-mannosaminyltransferase
MKIGSGVYETEQFLGLQFFNRPISEVRNEISRRAHSGSWSYVVTPNASHLVRIYESGSEVESLYQRASIILLDSRFVQILARALGLAAPPVITGSDLTAALFKTGLLGQSKLCIIGSSVECVENIRNKFHLNNVSHYVPSMGFISKPTEVSYVIDFVVSSAADYTFLAVGSPQQEIIAEALLRTQARGVGLCIGASIDFLGGEVKRAPRFLRAAGLEWLFRFLCEPRRLFHRYFIESPRIFRVVFKAKANLSNNRK